MTFSVSATAIFLIIFLGDMNLLVLIVLLVLLILFGEIGRKKVIPDAKKMLSSNIVYL